MLTVLNSRCRRKLCRDAVGEKVNAEADGDEEKTGARGEPRGGVPSADTIEDETAQGGGWRFGTEAEEGEDRVDTDDFRDEVEEANGGGRGGEREKSAGEDAGGGGAVGHAGPDKATLHDAQGLGADEPGGGCPDHAADEPRKDRGSRPDDGRDGDDKEEEWHRVQ